MRVEHIRNIPGPNVYSHSPVLVMTLDLENLYRTESYEVPGFIDRLLARLPGLHEHYCSRGRSGGFVERLHEGTWFGHIVEHVALELTDAAGIPVNRGKTVEAAEPGKFLVAVTYKSEAGMRCLLRVAVDLVEALIRDLPFDLDQRIAEARREVERTALGPSTQAIVDAAAARGIPYEILQDGISFVRLGYGAQARLLEGTVSSQTSAVAVSIACDKHLTKSLLSDAGIRVPRGCVVRSAEEAVQALAQFGPAVVVKPLDGNQGRGVSLRLESAEQVAEAFKIAVEHSPQVVIEEHLTGKDYRALVVNGRLVAASEKTPARVIGDDEHTIEQLIGIANRDPRRSNDHSKPLSTIEIDPVTLACLRKSALSLDSIPRAGETVFLRESANLSTGGEAADVTDAVHPENARLVERAARLIGLDICGLDLVLPDISRPMHDPANSTGGIVEVNAAPGIRMHCFPSSGKARNAGADIVEMLFPRGSNGRIPIVSVTGTNGKTSVVRMIAHAIASTGNRVGMTDTESITIDGIAVARGDMSGPQSARDVLRDPLVEVAVLETARGGIVKSGLGYDWSDVGVLTNIQADHFGQDGITSLDDIARIKGLVAERIREGGTLVLNADDEILATFPDRPRVACLRRNVIYFSLDRRNSVVRRHVANGGTAFVSNRGSIEEHRGERVRVLGDAASLPATWGGLVESQMANVLAAIAACVGYGMPADTALAALADFRQSRLSAFECGGRVVLLDYGHNPPAIRGVAGMVRKLEPVRSTCVLGLPGDRADHLLVESARAAAAAFDRMILREDRDLRGRQPGELAAIMESAVRDASSRLEVQTVLDEVAALKTALDCSEPGEVIVALYERKEPLIELLEQAGAQPLDDLPSLQHVLERHLLLSA